jgi:predicted metal-dependent enzyme (double-stranded beta helix superfamily)
MNAIGEPTRGHMQKLHHAADLTILNVVWLPNMVLFPHNHNMPAVIGIYNGREDNIFWRRLRDETKVEAVAAKALSDKDAVILGRDIIHSVTNPIARFTGALHVYAGDFFNEPRSEWNPETLSERPCDPQRIMRMFEAQGLEGAKA